MYMLTAFLQTDNQSTSNNCEYFSINIEFINLQFINDTLNWLTKVYGG